MVDEVTSKAWQVDPLIRAALRLERARQALEARDAQGALIEVEELLDEIPDHLDGLWVLAEAAMDLRDFLTAREAWKRLVEVGGGRAAVWTQLAVCCFECCDMEAGAEQARQAIRRAPDLADAHAALGDCLEFLEGPRAARPHHAEAHRLAPLSHPFPLVLDDAQWAELIERSRDLLTAEIRQFWSTVPFELRDLPDLEELRQSSPALAPRSPALYVGDPPDSGDLRADSRPSALHIYRANLARAASVEDAVEQLGWALRQEALDWLAEDG